MKKVNQIKAGAVLSYLSIAVNIVAALVYTPWMVKQIGQSDYGLYTLANSLITLFLVDFGLSAATARYVSKYHAEGNEKKVNDFLGVIYKLYIAIDVLIFVILIVIFFMTDIIYAKLTPEELSKFKIVYIIAALFSICNFPFVTLNGILTAYEKFIQLKLADLIYKLLVVGLMIMALLLGFGLYSLVTVNAIAGLLVVIYKLIIIHKFTNVKVNFKFKDKSLIKEIFSFSVWSTVATLAQRMIFNITPSILGAVSNSAAIAVFGIIVTIEGFTYTFATAINGMFMPKISRIFTKEDPEKNIMPLLIKVGRFQFALNGLIIVGFAIVGKLFIDLWMGNDYKDAYYGILLVTIPGIFFNSLQIANTTAIVTKKVNLQAYVNLVMGVINLLLSLVLSRFYGVIGACISIFVAYTVRAIGLNIVYYKKMNIDTICFAKQCYIKMSVPVLIAFVIGMVTNMFLPDGGWASLAVKGFVVVVEYMLVMAVLGVTKEERMALIKRFKK